MSLLIRHLKKTNRLKPQQLMRKSILLVLPLLFALVSNAREYHVSTKGNDKYPGTTSQPFRTINKAAAVAMPGDIITVHASTYREMITPPRGGLSENKRIVYRAAAGEKVIIKGSEIITGWTLVKDDLWKVQESDKVTHIDRYIPNKAI